MTDFNLYKFPNGFRLAWKKTSSETIFANLRINHGALHEKPGEEGIAHFLEHMLIEGGTDKYTPEEQAEIRGKFGYTNAFTSRDRTMIPWGMISSDLESYLDICSQMVFYPRLDKTVLERQRRVVVREIARKKGSPEFKDFTRFFWPSVARNRDHTYFVLGEEKVIETVTEEGLRKFLARGYNPNNMILMLVGNLPDNLIDLVNLYFANQPPEEGNPFEFSQVKPLTERIIMHSKAKDLLNKEDPENSNSQIMLGIVVPDETHRDSSALEVASEILGRSWTTGLKKRIRSEEGMSYDIGSSYEGDKNFGYFGIHGKVHSKRQERAINIIFEELGKLKTSRLDDKEVSRAKRRVTYRTANRPAGAFGNFINIDPVNVSTIAKMDYDLEGRIPVIAKLSRIEQVNAESLQRVANEYLPSDKQQDNYVLLLRDPLKK